MSKWCSLAPRLKAGGSQGQPPIFFWKKMGFYFFWRQKLFFWRLQGGPREGLQRRGLESGYKGATKRIQHGAPTAQFNKTRSSRKYKGVVGGLGDQTTENQQSSFCPGAAALDLIAGNTGTGNKRRERRRRHEGGSGLGDDVWIWLVGTSMGHFSGAGRYRGRNRHLDATGEALGGWAVGI